jgi:signal transduction histidine kinase
MRTRRLVQQLLDFARLEPGVPSGPMLPVDLARITRDVVGLHASQADERAVDLGAETAGPAYVMGIEAELQSLVANLVDNSLRYAPPGSAVTASVVQAGSTVELSVVDAGPGIPAPERERVFERFHRLPGDVTPGTGLGLSIVKSIAERHEASIRLEDAARDPNRPGLAVRIAFRAAAVAELHRPARAAAPAPTKNLSPA